MREFRVKKAERLLMVPSSPGFGFTPHRAKLHRISSGALY